jgi:glycerol-3-phosphate dehydrogenase (NAD(P)+)
MPEIGIVGTTGWATTLGLLAARSGHSVALWARSAAEAEELSRARQNHRLLPGVTFPSLLTVTASATEALANAQTVVFAVPSVTMRWNLQAVRNAVPADAQLVCATKGLEIETGKRMTELIAEELGDSELSRTGVISGPNLAPEIAAGKLSSATVAFPDPEPARSVQQQFGSDSFRVYTSADVIGVELGGALKNIIAIGAGVIDGLDMGANTKAVFVTRGLHEITRLGVAMGARPETFAGLSGMGDLIATCHSNLSRNYRLGQFLASGLSLPEALEKLGRTAEGVPTTRAAVQLAKRHGVEMPIAETTLKALTEGLSPREAAIALMTRAPQPEVRF